MAELENQSENFVASWVNEEQLNEITMIHRNHEIVEGIIRSIFKKNYRVSDGNGGVKVATGEILVIALSNGVTAYCPAQEFSIRPYTTYRHFVGRKKKFMIERIDLDTSIITLSGKKAQVITVEELWETVTVAKADGTLEDLVYEGVITGVQADFRGLFVNIDGFDTFMPRGEWSYNNRDILEVEAGEIIQVKIIRVDEENKKMVVSRKLTLPDPFVFLRKLPQDALIAGRVTRVHPVNGIHVELENGLDVKASKKKELDNPIVGDLVSCRIVTPIELDSERGRINGRVLIIQYPNGKRKRKELGSFLFSND